MQWHKWGPPWHLPADVPAPRVELLGRALHPQPQLQAEDGPGSLHPSWAPGPQSWWLPSPTLVSLCPSVPSHPWCGLFLPPALGFFLRKCGRRRPDPDVRGAAGRGSRECCCQGYFWPWLPPCHRKGHPGAQHSHTGAATCLDISPVSPHSPCTSTAPQTASGNIPPNTNKASSATPLPRPP